MLQTPTIQPQAYRDAMAQFAGAVHVVTTDGPAGRRGATVIAACSVSDEPPTVLVCLSRKSPGNDVFVDNGCFALNTLGAHHEELSTAFSGVSGLDQETRFGFGAWGALATGAPVLSDAIVVFDCQLVEPKDVATHRVLFGRVTGLRIGDSVTPLIYHRRGYRHL
ncbi:MAG: flavin reductase [Rhizobiaceae bacterium]|nr:flavin reductase [Rhizobiaceae bacterium]MCV0408865.1 flavin reductase [Rhizobiaceae bacterium]